MFSFLLAVIYASFISLGLPDSLLGSAWPLMSVDLSVSLSYMGIVSMIIAAGTVISSLLSDKLTSRLGTGPVTAISVAMTAVALFGFSISNSFWLICLFAIPYGLGAGAVDAALNNYVALHYASRHMSWLHCFWGIGATAGPYIMGAFIGTDKGWRAGYGAISLIQALLVIVLFISLPFWKKRASAEIFCGGNGSSVGIFGALKIRGVKAVMLAFFGYCALESTIGLWASSYLVEFKGVSPESAAIFASLFYLGITLGRFISGFIADRMGDRKMVRIGLSILFTGILLIALPININFFALAGLVICGFGAAPIYPSVIHATPQNFGSENSQTVIGLQMASAYFGILVVPAIFGVIAEHISIALYPFYILLFAVLLLTMTERVNSVCKSEKAP